LLTHTAGLPLDLESAHYGMIDSDGVRFHTLNTRPSCPTDTVSYSNLGYGWIAYALEHATGQSLGTLLHRYGLVWGDALDREPVVIADVRSPHSGTRLEPINSWYWRSLRLPWAGAFGTLPVIARLLRALDPRVSEKRVGAAGGFPQGAYFGFVESAGCLWEDANWGCGIEFRGHKFPHWVTPAASPDSYGLVGSSGICAWQDGDTTVVLAGPRTTDGGWLLRQGPRGTALAFELAKHGSDWPGQSCVALASVRRSVSAS
jgi:CubicO group peptidase (beta-lactamase class C family)